MATYDLQMQDIARQYSSGQISTEKFNDFCNQLKNRMMSDIQKERELGVQIEISNDTQIVRKIRERLKNPVGLTVEELQEIVGTESETSGPHK
jgi:predicted DNA-binding transcriptional regulator YafY